MMAFLLRACCSAGNLSTIFSMKFTAAGSWGVAGRVSLLPGGATNVMITREWPGAVGTPYSSMCTSGKLCLWGWCLWWWWRGWWCSSSSSRVLAVVVAAVQQQGGGGGGSASTSSRVLSSSKGWGLEQ